MGVRMFKVSCGTCGSKTCKCKTRGRMGVSSGTTTRPHNCMSPGCTRRGEPEKIRFTSGVRPHNCMSPGCTRRGESERVQISTEVTSSRPVVTAPDPDPFRFTITQSYSKHGVCLLRVTYHGCTNYEGEKILLMRKDISVVTRMQSLDPHFLENAESGLIARFVPTEEGWEVGLRALHSLV